MGSLLYTIHVDDLILESIHHNQDSSTTDVEDVASYNWLSAENPTILVPGKPPRWTPPFGSTFLLMDSGTYARDKNASRYPTHPMEPAVRAILLTDPTFPTSTMDMFTCNDVLAKLLEFASGVEHKFRILIEVVGKTVFMIRVEKSPYATFRKNDGYDHTFPEAYTTWDDDVKQSECHQRIIRYRFGGLKCLMRLEADAYLRRLSEDEGDGLKNNYIAPGTQPDQSHHQFGSLRVIVNKAIKPVPREFILDIKTWGKKARLSNKMLDNEASRYWATKIPNAVLACHNNGEFNETNFKVHTTWKEIMTWKKENAAALRNLSVLLNCIVNLAKNQDGGRLELVRTQKSIMEVRLPDRQLNSALPNDAAALWIKAGGQGQ